MTRRVIIMVLTVLLIVWMIANAGSRAAVVIAQWELIVPLTFLGGILGLVHAYRGFRREGMGMGHIGVGVVSLILIGWAFQALRLASRRIALNHGYQEAGAFDLSNLHLAIAMFLVICGIFIWRWMLHVQVVDRYGRIGEILWPVPLLIWTAIVVFYGRWIEDLLLRIYQIIG